MNDVLLYGGTSEGKELALALAEAGVNVRVSVASQAGADSMPADVEGLTVQVGKLSQEEKIRLMQGFDAVVDATHPYATEISAHVAQAARESGIKYIRVLRPQGDVSGCTVVANIDEAVAAIGPEGNVLSTTGSKEVAAYAALENYRQRVFARVLNVDASLRSCYDAGLDDEHILAKRGPFSVEENLADIDAHDISIMVTKDGGDAGGYPEKLAAARARNVRVIVIDRPQAEEGVTVEEAFKLILERSEA